MTGQNNGGKNSFYAIPDYVRTFDDLVMWLGVCGDERKILIKGWEYRPNKEAMSWYAFPEWVEDVDTLNEWLGDSFYFGNFLKTFWINRGLRHNGTSVEREKNKRMHYLRRLKEKSMRGVHLE